MLVNNMGNVLCFGEVLWDNLPEGRRVGGAPLNVCYHLNKQGVASQIVSQVGHDINGKELLAAVVELGVDVSYLDQSADHPTSTVEVHVGEEGKVSYEIVEHVAWDFIEYNTQVAKSIEQADAFVFGSLAARDTLSRETLLRYLSHAACPVFDINLRQPFYASEFILELLSKCKILKINDDELVLLAGWIDIDPAGEDAIIAQLFVLYPGIEEVILTKGAKGASYFDRNQKIDIAAVAIKVKDTVGSGDSFLAAFLASKIQGKSVKEALEKAVSLSAFVATHAGACPAY